MQTKSQQNRPVALVRLTLEESEKLSNYVNKIGVKRSKLFKKVVREIINNEPDLIVEEMKEFKNAVRQLSGISANLNQITRAINSGKVPKNSIKQSYYSDLNDNVNELKNKLNLYIDATINRWI